MKGSPFSQHLDLRHAGNDYPESRIPAGKKGCYVCGGRPVLRVAGDHGYCKLHAREAWEAAAKAMGTKWD